MIDHRENEDVAIGGLGLWLCGVELFLSMTGFPNRRFDGRDLLYRPLEIHTVGRKFERSLGFSWTTPGDNGTITMTLADAK